MQDTLISGDRFHFEHGNSSSAAATREIGFRTCCPPNDPCHCSQTVSLRCIYIAGDSVDQPIRKLISLV